MEKMIYRGIRRAVYGKSGGLLYESNDTPAKRIWDLLERTVLPARSRDIVMNRFPAKQIWDALALGQVILRPDLNPRQKFNCLKFYFDGGGINNLFATLTRSGTAWSILTIDLALDLANGGEGAYTYKDNFWHPQNGVRYAKLDWRMPAGNMNDGVRWLATDPVYYHTHHPYYRTRCRRVKDMKVVIVVRSILESLESNFFKAARSPAFPDTTVEDEDSFPWNRNLDDAIEFYNSWGDVAKWHGNCLVLRYHERKADPVGTHKAITDFWDLDIPVECLEEALKRTSKKAMAEKIPQEEHGTVLRVSYRKERGVISKPRRDYILERLQRELIHDFGYDYSENHQWGHFYD